MSARKRDKQVNLQIWCSEETKREFRMFVVEGGFKNAEEALRYLLELAKEHKWLRREERVY